MLDEKAYIHLKYVPKGVYFGQSLHNYVKKDHV